MIIHMLAVASTQDEARSRIADTRVQGVRANYQSAGRGRRGAVWQAPPGTCLLLTCILRNIEQLEAAKISITAGVTVAEAVEAMCGVFPLLKWPNDILVENRKLGGILVEIVPERNTALVGIGINVNVDGFPDDLKETAISLKQATGREWSMNKLEDAIVNRMFHHKPCDWTEVLTRWRNRDGATGRRCRAVAEGGDIFGTVAGIDDDGALIVETDEGRRISVVSAQF